MHLFIDANIFLDFFHLTSTDLEELRKLIALIEEKTLTLYMPEQTCDEISRNRDGKIADAMNKFRKDGGLSISFPAFTKSFEEFDQIQDLLKQANKTHSELYAKAQKSIEIEGLDADKLIKDLINNAKVLDTSSAVFQKAVERFRKGNPPGKSTTSVGDEINWECLKEAVPQKSDLFIVSGDRDYKSAFGDGKVNQFLANEWAEDKQGTLHFYETLTDFFKTNFPQIKLAADVKTVLLIDKLAKSGSFATTHVIVGALLKDLSFTAAQVEEMVSIAEINSQVGGIIGDSDLDELYTSLRKNYSDVLSQDVLERLDQLIGHETDHHEQQVPIEDEIPF